MKLSILILLLLLPGLSATAQSPETDYVPGRIYVRLAPQSDALVMDTIASPWNEMKDYFGLTSLSKPFPSPAFGLDRTWRLHFANHEKTAELLMELRSMPEFDLVEQEPLSRTQFTPNDLHANQWYLEKINAELAWDVSKGKSTVIIAIVDNAISITHEDLVGTLWENPGEKGGISNFDDDFNGYVDDFHGYDVADMDPDPSPPPGKGDFSGFVHGTHVAGIASATTDNGKGIAGLGYQTRIMAVKCTPDASADDGKSLPNAYDGVYYALNAGADIISMSWGGTGGIFVTGQAIIQLAQSQGVTLIAAAGNNNADENHFPAAYAGVIGVGSTDQQDLKSSFSNYGDAVDIMAPGSAIYSCLSGTDQSYGYLSGTSMATPLVAGLAGLILSEHPAYNGNQVLQELEQGAVNIDGLNPGFENQLGGGRIDAAATLGVVISGQSPLQHSSKAFVYPNPAQAGKRVHFVGFPESGTLQLLDGRGTAIAAIPYVDRQTRLPDLEPGVYLLRSDEGHLQRLAVY